MYKSAYWSTVSFNCRGLSSLCIISLRFFSYGTARTPKPISYHIIDVLREVNRTLSVHDLKEREHAGEKKALGDNNFKSGGEMM